MISTKLGRQLAVISAGNPIAAGQLDEQSYGVLTAVSAIAGHLEYIWLCDTTIDQCWGEADMPVTVGAGDVVFATIDYCNDDPYASHVLTCDIEFLDPDGLSVGKNSETMNIAAGGYRTMGTLDTILSKVGAWTVHAVLSG